MSGYLQQKYQVSVRRSCQVTGLHRSMWYYQTKKDDQPVMDKLSELAEQLPTRGFESLYIVLLQIQKHRNGILQ